MIEENLIRLKYNKSSVALLVIIRVDVSSNCTIVLDLFAGCHYYQEIK